MNPFKRSDPEYTPKRGWPGKRIGPPDNPYMLRFFIFKVGNLPRLYLHKFLRSDYDRGLHDHPWWFVSIILRGSYIEHLPGGVTRVRRRGSIAFHRATDSHRVELFPKVVYSDMWQPQRAGDYQPVWTLFISGPVVRQWGFWCKNKPFTLTIGDTIRHVESPGEHWVPAEKFYGCD